MLRRPLRRLGGTRVILIAGTGDEQRGAGRFGCRIGRKSGVRRDRSLRPVFCSAATRTPEGAVLAVEPEAEQWTRTMWKAVAAALEERGYPGVSRHNADYFLD
jgi:hypothetical protein